VSIRDTNLNGVQMIEIFVVTIQRSLVAAYEECCPLKTADQGWRTPYWDSQLGELRKSARRSWNRRQSDPDAYHLAVKAYDQALRAGKRTSFLRDSCLRRLWLLRVINLCVTTGLWVGVGIYIRNSLRYKIFIQ
jgi:hypothetical protein